MEPADAAKAAGLRYVDDTRPGITREPSADGFTYKDPSGKSVTDPEILRRIRSLSIPPAYTDVWICPREDGHLQATGRDARRRKQYRYHPRWREVRDEAKYSRTIAFAEVLPKIRQRAAQDLKLPGMPREKVLATVITLLERTLIRVGNDEYAQQNKSFGLTTLRNRHAKVRGSKVTFDFVGKSGKAHSIPIEDPKLAKIVRRCQDLPGQELFGYVDPDGNHRDVTSEDVNSYLREVAGTEFTAKDFRTWAGTVLAAVALQGLEQFTSAREAKKNITRAVEAVAQMLGNTPAVCRKCYVHPAILESYVAGETIATLQQRAEEKLAHSLDHLRPDEAAVMMFLRERLAAANAAGGTRQAKTLSKTPVRKTPRRERKAAAVRARSSAR